MLRFTRRALIAFWLLFAGAALAVAAGTGGVLSGPAEKPPAVCCIYMIF